MSQHQCTRCGGSLFLPNDSDPNRYKCRYCGKEYNAAAAEQNTRTMEALFSDVKRGHVNNLRRVLYDAVTAEYISRTDVVNACDALKEELPDDFAANFYKVAAGKNTRALNQAINAIDVEAQYDDLGVIISFLVKSLTADTDCLLSLNRLVERAYKNRDLSLFSMYATMVSRQAEKVREGVYETAIPRKVFVAYSSKDLERVGEVVEALEEQGISCFVAARNLRHGVGSVENYNAALAEAMDNCRIFLFVSSLHSRNMNCDALTVEMAHIKRKDIDNAPPECRNDYASIPPACKKPRVEFRIEESGRFNIADTVTDEFFDGYERVYDVEGLLRRVAGILVRGNLAQPAQPAQPARPTEAPKPAPAPVVEVPKPEFKPVQSYSEGLEYSLTEDKQAYIVTGIGECTDIELRIPPSYRGLPVTSIGQEAFSECEVPIISLIIPDGVTSIEHHAFQWCSTLLSITLPPSMTFIGKGAFVDCCKLVEVYNLSSLDITRDSYDSHGYVGNSALNIYTSPTDESKLHTIRDYIFYADEDTIYLLGYTGTDTALTLPAKFKGKNYSIYKHAFYYCDTLTSVSIPIGVTEIDQYAFAYCDHLTSISIPVGLTDIRYQAFEGCDSLNAVHIADIAIWCSVQFFESNPLSYAQNLYLNGDLVTDLVIPDGVPRISGTAFSGCNSITSITIPNSVTSIDHEAFSHCCGLKKITIPNSVTSIGEAAFAGCNALTQISLPNGLTSISRRTFASCTNLASITLPRNVTNIGDNAFNSCRGLTSITIPDSVTSIGEAAFEGCKALTQICLPDGLTSISESAFSHCTTLKNIALPAGVTSIGKQAFSYCTALTDLVIPNSVTTIGKEAFFNCSDLSSIAIPAGVTSIDSLIFYYCGHLSSITLPDSITSIEYRAFFQCVSLTHIMYTGTKKQWEAIQKGQEWNYGTGKYTVRCSNGELKPSIFSGKKP